MTRRTAGFHARLRSASDIHIALANYMVQQEVICAKTHLKTCTKIETRYFIRLNEACADRSKPWTAGKCSFAKIMIP